MPDPARALARRLHDQRSGRVIFLAHCLLNQNTRYLGGACRACCVEEIVRQCIELDLGIVQMPCPEERAWGGVMKRRFLRLYGLARRRGVPRGAVAAIGVAARFLTGRIYRRLARQVARQVKDYDAAGWRVVGIIGVDGSPSCGVTATMDIGRAVADFAALDPRTVTPAVQNATVASLVEPGMGVFIAALGDELGRHGLRVPFRGHDLLAELRGERSALDLADMVETPPAH